MHAQRADLVVTPSRYCVERLEELYHLHSGAEIGFEKLVVATGAQMRRLNIPGADLSGIYYLRTLEDSKLIRDKTGSAKRAVVIGGGFIAMEVSLGARAKGGLRRQWCCQKTASGSVSSAQLCPSSSRTYYAERGVRFANNTKVMELKGAGAVKSAVLQSGEILDCEMVVAGIGVTPSTELLLKGGIELKRGVVVNEYLETSQSDILAAGDVANYYDVLFDKHRRAEHWDNAVSQGQHCARALLGERTPFIHVPYFFSDVFDLSYEFWGDPSGAVSGAVPARSSGLGNA